MKKRFFHFASVAMLLMPFLALMGCGEGFDSGLQEEDTTSRQRSDHSPPPTFGSVFDTDDRASGDSFDDSALDSAEVLTALVWLEKLDNGNMRVMTRLPAQQKTHILVRISHWAHKEDEAPFIAPWAIITIEKNASFSFEFLPEPEHWTRAIRVQIQPFEALSYPGILKEVKYKTAEGYDIPEGYEFTAPYRAPEGHTSVDFFHFPE